MATKERLIVKTSYMDVLERMLRKRGVKVVMSGVREMTLAEEIRNLAELGVDQNVIDRMTQKYNRMLTGELIVGAISNPYVLSLVVVSIWNTLNDPTTKGLGDSARAKSYTAPQ